MSSLARFGFSLFTALIPLAAAHGASTWYVDVNGVAPGNGTEADPYTSIQYAIDRPSTVSGDRILVLPGTYVENVIYHWKVLDVESVSGPTVTWIQGGVTLGEDSPFSYARLSGFRVNHVNVWGAKVDHCLFIANEPGREAMFYSDMGRIEHCTITGFAIAFREFAYSGNPIQIRNTILWNNVDVVDAQSGGGNMSFCAGQSFGPWPGWTTSNHVGGDPGMWNHAVGDVHLKPGSACIDAGNPTGPLDPDGSRADIGALPFDASYGPTPIAYCSGKLNGQGCVPSVSGSGHCSATNPSAFWITATEVSSNKFGRLFYGFAPASIPFVGGLKCIAAPTTRTALSDSGGSGPCTGVLSYDFNARIQSGFDPGLSVGRLVYAQFWYRDPADPAGFGLGLSDALCFGIAP